MRVTGHSDRVGDALKEIPGVLKYDANQFTHEVTVRFDDTKTSIDKIVEGLAKEDFPIKGSRRSFSKSEAMRVINTRIVASIVTNFFMRAFAT